MSEFDERMDSNNVICPYCGYDYQPESEDFDEDEQVEKCGACGKSFYHHDVVTYDHCTRPDCELNGENHKWETLSLRSGDHDFCEVCGVIKPLSQPPTTKEGE